MAASLSDQDQSAVSWSAILAGGIAAAALTLLLLAVGMGLGFTVVSPWSDAGISVATFKLGTGVYLIVVAMVSSTIGGYLAGRLRTKWTGTHTDEVFFRDTAHGFLAWAFATVLSAIALGGATTHLLSGATSGVVAQSSVSTSTPSAPSSAPMSEEARKTAAKMSLWLAAAMLLGAFSASLAATEGGMLRDGNIKSRIRSRSR